ncbi:hypothetical protein GSB9_00447 [Flavobacteriaceae bacterium GSB9]|nr:hypothetical protein GSB9_00447 [Flavobacteriaceae bacterium GSB9]
MATVSLKGSPINTLGALPNLGTAAPNFELSQIDLTDATLYDYKAALQALN